jgi:uncharacterized damage-inducible protein DinB
MNRSIVGYMWEELRLINGITLRVIGAIPKDKIDVRPIGKMRTPKELVAHIYTNMRIVAEGIAKGAITEDERAESGVELRSLDDMLRYARDCWNAADRVMPKLTDAQIQAMVKTPWGMDMPGHICSTIIYDEHLHHRGQLYAFLRALGAEPPFMWDFENSAPEFRPRVAEKA